VKVKSQAAQALNEMRKRVRTPVDERTQMLIAISHDLRTPLTQLRLRIERLNHDLPGAAALQDIRTVDAMLGETPVYLREGSQPEEGSLVDLPSLLETISTSFADVGYEVAYRGPDHLTFAGRAQAIARNVVEQRGGSIELVNREPSGRTVRMTFSPLPQRGVWDVASAA
jgi:hypothetical protein